MEITSPSEGEDRYEGAIPFTALAVDGDGGDTLTLTWRYNDMPVDGCNAVSPDVSGTHSCTIEMLPDMPTVYVEVQDGTDSATDSVTLNIVATNAPSIEIVAPTSDGIRRYRHRRIRRSRGVQERLRSALRPCRR